MASLLATPYAWVLFLHLFSVLLFLLAHGPSMWIMLAVRRERDPVRVRALMELSGASVGAIHLAMFLMLGSGLALAWMGDWWGAGWVWASLALLVAMWVLMYALGSRFYDRVRGAVGARMFYLKKGEAQPPPESFGPLEALLASRRPYALAAVGGAGLTGLLWLMLFKPF